MIKTLNYYLSFRLIFIISFIVFACSIESNCQTGLPFNQTKLSNLIEVLEDKYGVFFNYKSEDIADIAVDLDFDSNESLDDILKELNKRSDLNFELTQNKYVIVRSDKKDDEINKSLFATTKGRNPISGRIVDSKSRKPIQYANIFYKNNQRIGTLSEPDGRFVLRSIESAQRDTLVISILGYETKNIPIASIEENELKIQLQIQAYELDEISIVDQSYLKKLLVKAVENIPHNYPNQKHRLTGYFQEASITQGEYSHFLESYLTVENQDYSKNCKLFRDAKTNSKYPDGDHKVKYHQIRRSDDTRYLPNRFKKSLGGSIHEILNNNYVYEKSIFSYTNHTLDDVLYDINNLGIMKTNKPPSDLTDLDEEDRTILKLIEPVLYSLGTHTRDKDTLITIGVSTGLLLIGEDGAPVSFRTARVVINKSNFAIESIIKTMNENLIEKYPDADFDDEYEEIQYRRINNKYYPSLIINRTGLNYNMETRKEFSTTKFIVQEVQLNKNQFLKIKPSKKLRRDERLVEKKYKYDPEFWSSYPIPKKMEAPLALKLDLARHVSLEEQFKRNEKRNK